MIRRLAPALLLLTAAAPPAPSPAYDRAIAAGYKALTLCNGIFLGGRTERQIAADELTGIYPEYQAIVPTLDVTVDKLRGVVLVDVSKDMPPRRAVYGPDQGCTLRPNGYIEPEPEHGRIIYLGPPASPPKADARAWPQGDRTGAIRPSKPMAETVALAFDAASFGAGSKTTGVVVLHDGRMVAERYAAGWDPYMANRTWSAAKSIAGTLIGLANRQQGIHERPGMTDMDRIRDLRRVEKEGVDPSRSARVGDDGFDGDPRMRINLDNLLRMASGLHSDTAGNRTDALYTGLTTVDQEAAALSLEAWPGTRFRYANNDILLAVLSLRSRLGEDRYRTFPRNALFAPLGMAHTWAGTDWHGNYLLSSQVWSTARDLARLGQFWLQDGVWQGQRLLPEGWMTYMTTPSGPQPADGPGYGATMWLFGPKQGLPAGSYAAQGNRGQFIMVVPSERLVVVRRGEDPGAARFDIAAFTARVMAALR